MVPSMPARRDRCRQRLVPVLCCALLAGTSAAAPAEPKGRLPEPLQPDALVLLSSYGEQPNDLIELLVPFLAKRGFAADRPRQVDPGGAALASFTNSAAVLALRDFIIAGGRFNCVLVAYYSSSYERLTRPANGVLRSAQFRIDLEAFLQSLPTPRVSTRDIDWQKKTVECPR